MSEAFADVERAKWMWCHHGTTLHILWLPDLEDIRERLFRANTSDIANAAMPYALCGTDEWKISDSDRPQVGREDLICGACLYAYAERYGTEEEQVTPVSAHERYAAYLESAHWQHMRAIAREHYGEQCVLCGSADELDVYHRTYERRGRERLSDVTVLCRNCHAKHHGQ